MIFKKNQQTIELPKRTYYNQYGRCINVSTGLILGLFIDKSLFILTKGLSVFIPPFAVMLLTKGKKLFSIRFEITFPKIIEKFISHLI